MSIETRSGWKCMICSTVYDSRSEAMTCCEDEKQERMTGYECTVCRTMYDNKDDAIECCR